MSDVSKECFGEFNPDGSVKSEPSLFVSGRPFVVGMPSVRERVGTQWFYRVQPGQELTDDEREVVRAAAPQVDVPRRARSAQTAEDQSESKE